MSARVTIKLTTLTNPLVPSFLDALRNSYEILRDLDAAISAKPQGTLSWRIIDLRLGSATATFSAESMVEDLDVGPAVAKAYIQGLEQIGQFPVIPNYFSEDTLEKAKALVGVLDGEVSKITVTVPGFRPVTVTQHIAANVDALIGPQHEALGALEGTLETLSVHGRPYFNIYETLTNRKVVCHFPESMVDEAHRAFRKRVAAYGKVKYTRTGRPLSIAVEQLRVLREKQDLPQAKDLEGIDLTGGVDATEHIRRLRDAQ